VGIYSRRSRKIQVGNPQIIVYCWRGRFRKTELTTETRDVDLKYTIATIRRVTVQRHACPQLAWPR
jgi:hypothetical protein